MTGRCDTQELVRSFATVADLFPPSPPILPRETENPLMDFESRLQKAIERGHQAKASAEHERQRAEMTEEECKSLHSRCRLQLSEHIEHCLKQVADHFPAFDFNS